MMQENDAVDEKSATTSLASFKKQNKAVQNIFSAVWTAIARLS